MKRRDFFKKTAVATVAANALPAAKLFADGNGDKNKPLDFVAIHGGEASAMFERGIEKMGGMSRFVKKGQKVVIKPNIGWDQRPDVGANTDPGLVRSIIRSCKQSGASEIFIFDHTCGNDWNNRYNMSGIAAVAKDEGVEMVPGNTRSFYEEASIPKGVILKNALVHKLAKDPDVFINVPVLKHHSGAKITCALKNYMGCVWDRRFWHDKGLPQCIADYATFQKTTLTIVDAYRVMLEHGPRGRSPKYAPVVKYQIISTDMVAADTAAVKIFEQVAKEYGMGIPYPLEEIEYLKLAENLGVGTMDLSRLNIDRIEMA